MRKSITYRKITIAIGVLVALVIALTMWIREPEEAMMGSPSRPHSALPSAAKNLLQSTSTAVSDLLWRPFPD